MPGKTVETLGGLRAQLAGLSGGLTATVVVDGELDLASAAELDDLLSRARAAQPDRLVVDITGLRFMDANGIGVIAAAAGEIRQHGGVLHVAGASPLHRDLFGRSGLGDLLV